MNQRVMFVAYGDSDSPGTIFLDAVGEFFKKIAHRIFQKPAAPVIS